MLRSWRGRCEQHRTDLHGRRRHHLRRVQEGCRGGQQNLVGVTWHARAPHTRSSMADSLITPVSVVESVGLKFVILDAPNDSNVHIYLEALKKENVGHVVRVCDPSYDTSSLLNNNIAVHVSVITFSRTHFFAVVVLLSRESCSCPCKSHGCNC